MLVKLGLFPQGRDDHKKIFWVATTQLSKIIPNILKQKKGHDLRLFNGGSHCCLRKNILGPCNKILNLTRFIWMFPKIVGFPPKSSIFLRVFHYFHHPFWGFSPYLWFNTHINVPFRPHHPACRCSGLFFPAALFLAALLELDLPLPGRRFLRRTPGIPGWGGRFCWGWDRLKKFGKKPTKKFEKGKEVVSSSKLHLQNDPFQEEHISYSNSIFGYLCNRWGTSFSILMGYVPWRVSFGKFSGVRKV